MKKWLLIYGYLSFLQCLTSAFGAQKRYACNIQLLGSESYIVSIQYAFVKWTICWIKYQSLITGKKSEM